VSASLAWYDLTVDNALVANPDPLFVGTSVQAGRKQSRGVDLDLTWQASPQWHSLLALSRASATISEDSRAALVGKQLFNVPRTTARVATRYTLGSGSALPGLGLGLGLTHHSALPGDNTNSYFTPSATVFDAQAGYRLGQVQLSLNVRNLTDKKVWEPSRYFGGGQVTPAPRRTVALQGQVTF
jgi:iron complex outermembrane receptor protein